MAASCRELPGLAGPASARPQPRRSRNELCFAPQRQEEPRRRSRRGVTVVAAVSEELPRLASAGKGAGAGRPPPAGKVALRAAVTVRRKQKEDLKEAVAGHLDALWDMVGRGVVLELVSAKIDPRTKKAVRSGGAAIKDWSQKRGAKGEHVVYTAEFTVDAGFGEPGAVTVANRHHREFFLESIFVEGAGLPSGAVYFDCNSWVQTTAELPGDAKRVFFSNKPYLPSQTPPGLREIRENELRDLRGDGTGVRKISDRIYEYAMYNDLGNPDRGKEFIRPILGGDKIPYPRRCRTGRPPTDTNMLSESRVEKPHRIYVPRDETFEELKQGAFISGRLRAVLHTLIPSLIASISADTHNFQGFHHIDNLYKEGLRLKLGLQEHLFQKIPLVQKIQESSEGMLRYDTPSILSKDKFAWLRDDEFARQALAGINPVSIERLTVFPPVSKLDPAIYGPPESSITERHIAGQLNGLSVQEAIDKEKLFIVDHHDVYMPFLDRINAIEGRKAYATRTIFFLTQAGTLKPIAIELSLPPAQSGEPQTSKVLTPACDATSNWIWMLGKAHVSSNDAGVHQLVNHWLRTHAIMEPFILAAHRRMSAMHPIFKLLHPHMRYTLEINALARQSLINAEGVIESCFTPGPVSFEISSAYYRNHWRFDLEGLPADLLRRHGSGCGRRLTASWHQASHRGLPLCKRRASAVVCHWQLGRVLRAALLPGRRHGPVRRRAPGVVPRVHPRRPRRYRRRAMVAAAVHAARPGLHPDHARVARVGAARRAQLRAVPAGRLRPEPAAADATAAAGPGARRGGVRHVPGGPAPVLPQRDARGARGDQVHGGGGHAVHALPRRGVSRREPRRGRRAVDGRRGGPGGARHVRGRRAPRRGDHREAQRRARQEEPVRRRGASVRAAGPQLAAGGHLPRRAQQHLHMTRHCWILLGDYPFI